MTKETSHYETSARKLMSFLKEQKIVTESAKTAIVPSMVRFIVGAEYSGSWWSLPQSSRIYNALQPVREHRDVHVCRLLHKKICFIHRDVWAPLLALSGQLPEGALDKVVEVHQETGTHSTTVISTPDWAPEEIRIEAAALSVNQARAALVAAVPRAETVLSSLKL